MQPHPRERTHKPYSQAEFRRRKTVERLLQKLDGADIFVHNVAYGDFRIVQRDFGQDIIDLPGPRDIGGRAQYRQRSRVMGLFLRLAQRKQKAASKVRIVCVLGIKHIEGALEEIDGLLAGKRGIGVMSRARSIVDRPINGAAQSSRPKMISEIAQNGSCILSIHQLDGLADQVVPAAAFPGPQFVIKRDPQQGMGELIRVRDWLPLRYAQQALHRAPRAPHLPCVADLRARERRAGIHGQ